VLVILAGGLIKLISVFWRGSTFCGSDTVIP